MRASRIDGIDGDAQDKLIANVDGDKKALDELATTATAAGDTSDLRQVGREVRALRAENYVLAVNILRHAVRVSEAAADNLDAADAVGVSVNSAVEKALAITASSSKADVKAARAGLVAAQALLDDATETDTGAAPLVG